MTHLMEEKEECIGKNKFDNGHDILHFFLLIIAVYYLNTCKQTNMSQIKRPLRFNELFLSNSKRRRGKFFISTSHRDKMKCLEHLSNEIYYEIFEYLHGVDIYQAFSNLNVRFQNLLTSLSIPLKITLNSESQTELLHHCNNVINPNRHLILSLSLQNNFLINNFFTFCPTDSSFDRLESVVLHGILFDTSIFVLLHLKSLPRLFSLTMDFQTIEDTSFDAIYQIIFSFSSLKYNKLSIWTPFPMEFINPFTFVVINQQFSTIQYLIINHSCTIEELLSILRYVPHLRHLSCQNLGESLTDIDLIEPIMLPNLTHVSIINPDIMYFEFEMFIMKLSTAIQILKIDLFDDITYLNAHRWEQLIIKHTPQLRQFYLIHRQSAIDLEDISLAEIANQFTSSFWIERQWFFECLMDCSGTHYSIRPYRSFR